MRYALVYGAVAGTIILALSYLIFFTGLFGHIESPLLGYLVMLVGLTMIFVGVKRFRDVEGGGVIRFGRALLLGFAIGLVAAILYVLAFEFYVGTVGGEMLVAIDQMLPGYAANTLYRMSITFLEIAPVVLVVALFSAAILRDPRVLPARGRA